MLTLESAELMNLIDAKIHFLTRALEKFLLPKLIVFNSAKKELCLNIFLLERS